jgi:head-tail adaptor
MRCVAKYDQKVQIQSLTGTADAHGHVDNTADSNWSAYADSFASVMSKGGREFWKVDRVEADVSHVWRCPWSRTVAAATPDMRLIHDSTTYEILSVIDIDLAHEEVEIQTRRAV